MNLLSKNFCAFLILLKFNQKTFKRLTLQNNIHMMKINSIICGVYGLKIEYDRLLIGAIKFSFLFYAEMTIIFNNSFCLIDINIQQHNVI